MVSADIPIDLISDNGTVPPRFIGELERPNYGFPKSYFQIDMCITCSTYCQLYIREI